MEFQILKSIFLFFLAGLAEIGGGYLVWLWLRERKSIWLGLVGDCCVFCSFRAATKI
jgi:small multidrug resistance family-3 protein